MLSVFCCCCSNDLKLSCHVIIIALLHYNHSMASMHAALLKTYGSLVLQDLGVNVNGKAHNRSVEDDFRHLHTQAQSIPHFRVHCCYLSFFCVYLCLPYPPFRPQRLAFRIPLNSSLLNGTAYGHVERGQAMRRLLAKFLRFFQQTTASKAGACAGTGAATLTILWSGKMFPSATSLR